MILMQDKNKLLERFRKLATNGTELPLYFSVPHASSVTMGQFRGRLPLMTAWWNIIRELEKARKRRTKNDYATFLMTVKPKAREHIEDVASTFMEAVAIESLAMHKEAIEGGVRKIFGHPNTVVVPDLFWKETAQEALAALKRIDKSVEKMIDRSTEDDYFGGLLEDNGRSFGRQVSDEAFLAQSRVARRVQGYSGATRYVWRTMKDVRVVGNPVGLYPVGNAEHGDHWSREGKIFSWDAPPHDGHPGEAYGCRCQAVPLFGLNNPEIR